MNGPGPGGRIDFLLPDVKWGIEILREGDRLGEHCQRFEGSGSYTPWIRSGLMTDWLIIDCRTTAPKPYGMSCSMLLCVMLSLT